MLKFCLFPWCTKILQHKKSGKKNPKGGNSDPKGQVSHVFSCMGVSAFQLVRHLVGDQLGGEALPRERKWNVVLQRDRGEARMGITWGRDGEEGEGGNIQKENLRQRPFAKPAPLVMGQVL